MLDPMKERRAKRLLLIIDALLIAGMLAFFLPMLHREQTLDREAAEYDALAESVRIAETQEPPASLATASELPLLEVIGHIDMDAVQTTDIPMVNVSPITPPSASQSAQQSTSRTGIDMAACLAANADFVAWLCIPGTKIDYPVVRTDDPDYYLTHSFTGKESSLGTLFSLNKTDYAAPSQNIAVYGHHITSGGGKMFKPLMSYKEQSFYAKHPTIQFDTLHGEGTYTIFAVIDMRAGDWDPSTASFADSEAFLSFIQTAKAQALYDTGVAVNADDQVLTLITCDRSYAAREGRLVVMAVKQ